VGIGSQFQLRLQGVEIVNAATVSNLEDSKFMLGDIQFEPATILIADDVPSNRELFSAFMTHAGFTLLEAETGKQALEYAQTEAPDIVFLDIRMPVMDGYETIRLLKQNEKTKNIPVIAMTASVLPETLTKINTMDFDGYLSKPASLKDILKQLSRFLPHNTDDHDQSHAHPQALIASLASIKNKNHLLARMKSELLPTLKDISGIMVMDEIILYGKSLQEIASEHNITVLADLANELVGYAETFDVSRIQNTIKELNSTFSRLQELLV
jgi:two-component system sensor histidine kinase EvgS